MNRRNAWLWAALALSATGLASCTGPLQPDDARPLREQMLATHRAYLQAVAAGPVVELSRAPSEVDKELTPERRQELDSISGPQTYRGQAVSLGPDLLGKPQSDAVELTLQRAIELAVQHNVELAQARLAPAITQTQVTQAEAAFDAILFNNVNWNHLDTPRPTPPLLQPTLGHQQADQLQVVTGIRKTLSTGAVVSAQTTFDRVYQNPSPYNASLTGGPFTYYDANIQLSLAQPLLRGFGSDVVRAQVVLARSAQAAGVQDLRRGLLETAAAVENAYWNLHHARQRLQIQERLLVRTIEDYRRIRQRREFDVNPIRLTEAGSFVESRRAEVIRARQEVRLASDTLKRLMSAPDLPLSGETLIVPLDRPADAPIEFSLLDAVGSALRHRPELEKALLAIKDASVRQRVADNARLPLFNLAAVLRYNGLDANALDQAYGHLFDGKFVDYVLGAQFEYPIGNRGPEAQYEQRLLERRLAVLSYQRSVQDVLLEVKRSMRELLTAYEIIGAARAARRAAADNLRAIERQEEAGVQLTAEFLLDLKLNSQQRLADAETQESRALADYNTAVANFYRTLGTLLERNGIVFQDRPGQ